MEKNLVDARSGELLMDLTTAKAIGKLLRASVIITGLLLVLQILVYLSPVHLRLAASAVLQSGLPRVIYWRTFLVC